MTQSQQLQKAKIIKLPVKHQTQTIGVVRQVKGAVDKKIDYLFEGLMLNVVDALFEELKDCSETKRLQQHFNITRALKVHGAEYKDEFLILMNLSWVNLIKGKNSQYVSDPSDDIGEMLRRFSDRNLNHYKILLEELRKRFSTLVRVELDYHPLLPGNFYLCFWYATQKLGLSDVERMLLVPLFNRFVMDRFGQMLSIANQSLVEMGIKAPKQNIGS